MADEKVNPGNVHVVQVQESYNPPPIITVITDLQRGFNGAPIAQAVQQVAQNVSPAPSAGSTAPSASSGKKS